MSQGKQSSVFLSWCICLSFLYAFSQSYFSSVVIFHFVLCALYSPGIVFFSSAVSQHRHYKYYTISLLLQDNPCIWYPCFLGITLEKPECLEQHYGNLQYFVIVLSSVGLVFELSAVCICLLEWILRKTFHDYSLFLKVYLYIFNGLRHWLLVEGLNQT